MRFFPRSFTAFLSRWIRLILVYLLGWGCVFFSVFMLVALISYMPADPSANSITGGAPKNWAGGVGAYVADWLAQIFGFGGYAVAVLVALWGRAILKRQRFLFRFMVFFPLIMMLFSGALAVLLPRGAVFPLFGIGGVLGEGLRAVFITHIPSYTVWFGLFGLGSALFLIVYISEVKRQELWRALRVSVRLAIFLIALPLKIFPFLKKILSWKSLPLRKIRFPSPAIVFFWRWRRDTKSAGIPEKDATFTQPLSDEEFSERVSYIEEEELPSDEETPRSEISPIEEASPSSTPLFVPPPLDLLKADPPASAEAAEEIEAKRVALEQALHSFGIKGQITGVCSGPVVTLFEFEPAAGVKSARVISHADDLALAMSAISVRIAVVPGRNVLGIELPNTTRAIVKLREILSVTQTSDAGTLPIVLGRDIAGQPVCGDLSVMPHLLIAGTTGSGKSVGVNAMILSLIIQFPPSICRFVMIDPKMLELSVYHDIPHLLTPVVTNPKKAIIALKWTVKEMERRYQNMSEANVRNLEGYNRQCTQKQDKLPFIIVVIDEMADLMMIAGKEIETLVQRLSQMARAAGIHLIAATQRPSVDVITGTIKANFPTRISYRVASKFDSRTILGEQGAETLLGRGDMLFIPQSGGIIRLHGPFVEDDEVAGVCQHLRDHHETNYIGDITEEDEDSEDDAFSGGLGENDDAFYSKAVELVVREQKISTSFVQRHLQIGYNRAARIVEQMEKEGLISAASATGKREILMGGGG